MIFTTYVIRLSFMINDKPIFSVYDTTSDYIDEVSPWFTPFILGNLWKVVYGKYLP